MYKFSLTIFSLFFVVNEAFAATGTGAGGGCSLSVTQLKDLIDYISCLLVVSVVPLLFTIATVAFIWGIIQMVLNPSDEEARKKGKSFMIWGIIGLFVMLSVWGLVDVFSQTFGVKTLTPQLSQ